MKFNKSVVIMSLLLAMSLCACGGAESAGEAGGKASVNTEGAAGQEGEVVLGKNESGESTEGETGSIASESRVEVEIPEYEPDEVKEDACFGTEEEAYEMVLETNTFEHQMDTVLGELEREGDWIRLSRGDIWFEISYRAAENVDEYLNSVIEYEVVQYYLQQTGEEPLDEFRDLVHEMTKPVETDKYRIPEVIIGGQECKVTCYEYPLRFSVLDSNVYQDAMDLVIVYRVDMSNGDALFYRGMRDHKTEFEFYMTQALDIWAIDSDANETLHDVTEARFKEYAAEYFVDPEGRSPYFLDEFDENYLSAYRLEEGLCELIETMEITIG